MWITKMLPVRVLKIAPTSQVNWLVVGVKNDTREVLKIVRLYNFIIVRANYRLLISPRIKLHTI